MCNTVQTALHLSLHSSFVDTINDTGMLKQIEHRQMSTRRVLMHTPFKLQSLFCTRKNKNSRRVMQFVKEFGGRDGPQKCSFFLLCKWCGNSTWWCPLFNGWFIPWSRFPHGEHEEVLRNTKLGGSCWYQNNEYKISWIDYLSFLLSHMWYTSYIHIQHKYTASRLIEVGIQTFRNVTDVLWIKSLENYYMDVH